MTEPPLGAESAAEPPPTPRWVKMAGAILVVLLLLVVIGVAIDPGDHGPGRHVPVGPGDLDVALVRSWSTADDPDPGAVSAGPRDDGVR